MVAVAEQEGGLRVLMNSNIRLVESDSVQVEQGSRHLKLKKDGIIVCTGGTSPTPFLESIGIVVETKFGTA